MGQLGSKSDVRIRQKWVAIYLAKQEGEGHKVNVPDY
jgi:hypothetical protein